MGARPTRVLIDARMLLGRFSGVARVVTQLVEHLAKRDDVKPVALCGSESYAPWVGRDDIELLVTDFARRDRSPFRRLLWEGTKLAAWIRRSGADLYHATWNSGVPSGIKIPTVLTIHDLIPWAKNARGVRARFQRGCYRWAVSSSARRASAVTAVSDFSRDEVCRTLGMDRGDVLTVRNGVSIPLEGSADSASEVELNDPFVLYVGGHEPRKNVAAVLRAMGTYWRTHDRNLILALTGTTDALCRDARTEFESLPPGSPVRFLGFPSDTALNSLYGRAQALIMLSTNEGFGLPVLEAMARGCPVIAADRASLPEVVGEAGILVEPEDATGVAGWIHSLRTDAMRRASMARAGLNRAERFTWGHTCEAMVRVYESAVQRRSSAALRVSSASPAGQNPE